MAVLPHHATTVQSPLLLTTLQQHSVGLANALQGQLVLLHQQGQRPELNHPMTNTVTEWLCGGTTQHHSVGLPNALQSQLAPDKTQSLDDCAAAPFSHSVASPMHSGPDKHSH